MKYKITFEETPKQEDVQILENGISEYDVKNKKYNPATLFAFFLRDDNEKIVGGCHGEIMYGHLFIGHIWVDEALRGQGYGTQLMNATEKFAREKACHFLATNTMDWQAPDFYKRQGFYIEFERHGFDKDAVLYYLRKDL